MIVICIGPVCIPGHMILAFLLGILHKYGWLRWIKQEWVTYRYWRDRYRAWRDPKPAAAAAETKGDTPPQGQAGPAGGGTSTTAGAGATAEAQEIAGGAGDVAGRDSHTGSSTGKLRQRPVAACGSGETLDK